MYMTDGHMEAERTVNRLAVELSASQRELADLHGRLRELAEDMQVIPMDREQVIRAIRHLAPPVEGSEPPTEEEK